LVALRSSVSKLRTSFTYTNVMATFAVFFALSGGGAYAAKKLKLKANSVSSSHIKNGQVTGADIADGAVGGSKLAPGAVTGDHILDGTLSGLDFAPESIGTDEIDESTLVVPEATSATNAEVAETANAVGNIEAQTIQFRQETGDGVDTTILNLGGLALTAKCASGGSEELSVTATTTSANASLIARWSEASGVSSDVQPNFTTGDSAVISGAGNELQGSLTYTTSTSPPSVVTVIYGADEDVSSGNATACIFNGTAFHHLTI
jgi:hypothetical protein